jgi:hypothetical protein
MSLLIKLAFKVISRAIEKDFGYFIAWQANLAMPFVDTYKGNLHRDANAAASLILLRFFGDTPKMRDHIKQFNEITFKD